jgi:anti-sigma factor RsiW
MPTNHGAPHLSEEQLARLQDGELPAAEAAHLEGCAECAERLRGLKTACAAYSEYRDSIRGPLLPPVPQPWRSLDELIAGREPARRPRFSWWWVPALAAACLLVLAVVSTLRTASRPSAQADRLLARSAKAPSRRDRMIALRVRGKKLLRKAELVGDAVIASDPDMARLQMLFQAARYSWREPLSARTFQAWRGAQKQPHDFVSTIARPGDQRFYRVRTDVAAGVLRSASLTLRADDLRPVAGDFEFSGEGPVAMEEAPDDAAEPAETPAPPPRPMSQGTPREIPASPEDTLRVLAALDEIGADAGEPVEVSQDAPHGRVVVRAGGLTPSRQREVAAALATLPRVTLDLQAGSRHPAPQPPAAPETTSASMPAALRQRFEDRLGGPVAVQEMTDRTLEASALTLAHAHAMEVLARNFPPDIEGGLSGADGSVLRQLRQHHVAQLTRLAAQIHGDLKPLLDDGSTFAVPAGDNGRVPTWQAGIPSLVASAGETDQLLNRLLAGSYTQSSGEDMLHGLASAIERLQWAIQSQLKQE